MACLRVIPKGEQIAAMTFFADKVVLEPSGWWCKAGDSPLGYVWSGYADVRSTPSDREVALVCQINGMLDVLGALAAPIQGEK